MLTKIKELIDAGLSVIPIVKGEKRPALPKWDLYQKERITFEEFSSKYPDSDVALICGNISGGVEVLDFDNHFLDAEATFTDFYNIPEVALLIAKGMPIVETRSGGYHVFFKSKYSAGNKKLARRKNDKGKPECLIETRGEGGYVLVSPSAGYRIVDGSLDNIPELTEDERELLLSACKSFNEYYGDAKQNLPNTAQANGVRSGDDYNASNAGRSEMESSLRGHGWTSTNGIHWMRPNKKAGSGISATLGKVAPNMFYVFSTNASPFEDGQGYFPFAVRALLEFRGDYAECAKDLGKRGFGSDSKIKSAVAKAAVGGYRLSPIEIEDLAIDSKMQIEDVKRIIAKSEDTNPVHVLEPEEKKKKTPAIIIARDFVNKYFDVQFNTVTQRYGLRLKGDDEYKPLNPVEIMHLAGQKGLTITKSNVEDVITMECVRKDFDPFIAYFESIKNRKTYNGSISKLATYFKLADPSMDEYFDEMLKKALVRQVRCAIEKSYYNRMIFTLISSAQEIGKSYFIRWMNPFLNDEYYTESVLSGNKDDKIAMTRNFIYNLEEVDNLGRVGISQLKAIISSSVINERAPYAKEATTMHRCCTFWASTNSNQFLEDVSNTRWITFEILTLDRTYSQDISVHDIWAEAYYLYRSGYDAELSVTEKIIRDGNNESVREVSQTEELILKYLVRNDAGFMRTSDIYATIIERHGKVDSSFTVRNLGRVLSSMKFDKHRTSAGAGWKCSINVNTNPF